MPYPLWLLLHCEVVVGCAHTLAQSVDVVIDDGRDARRWGAINRSRDQLLESKLKIKIKKCYSRSSTALSSVQD